MGTCPETSGRLTVITGNPIRPELRNGDRLSGLKQCGFTPDLPLVYVTGGAQGSAQINTLITQILPGLLPHAQVLHQCGTSGLAAAQQVAAELSSRNGPALAARYRPVAYVGNELADLLAAADVVIARSGAGTVAELAATGKPAILIPLVPSAADEQRRNALHAESAGAAICLHGEDARPDRLLEQLRGLILDPQRLATMASAALDQGKPEAAAHLARLILSAAHDDAIPT